MVYGDNVTVAGNWIHDLAYFYPVDPARSDGDASHSDGIQVQGGADLRIVGNSIEAVTGVSAAVQVTQDVSPTVRLSVVGNWIDGGNCSVNIGRVKSGNPLHTGFQINDNRFDRGRGHRLYGHSSSLGV